MTNAILMAEERQPVRWSSYDYSSAGAYFITVCVKGREPVFGTIVDGQMVHTEAGGYAYRCLQEIPRHFPSVNVDTAVVMPDHVHAILAIDPTVSNSDSVSESVSFVPTVGIGHARSLQRQTEQRQRTRPLETLPLAVGSYKSSVTRLVRASGNTAFQWQKSYHDRIIRDAGEYERIYAYIVDNPRRWTESRGAQL